MTFRTSALPGRTAFAAALVALAVLSSSGCANQKELLAMPTLSDVSPTSPKGKKCYDVCAQAEASCKHMCPQTEGLCHEDCVLDTKFCLRDCPDLINHNPDRSWLDD